MTRKTLPMSWALLLGLVLPVAVLAEEEPRALFDAVVEKYQGLSAYADRGGFLHFYTIDDLRIEQGENVHLTYVRPNRIDLATDRVRLLSDGETLTSVVNPLKQFSQGPAPKTLRVETFIDKPIGAFLSGGPLGHPLPTLLQLLFGADPAAAILEGSKALVLDEDREIDDQTYRTLRIQKVGAPDLVLLIDPDTLLVQQIEHAIDSEQLTERAPPGSKFLDAKSIWNAGEISTDDPADDAFAFQAPEGFTLVEGLSAALQDEAQNEPPAGPEDAEHRLVGKPAPEFTVTILDGEGTKQINKLDLAGKVVLIDFWATWCGPCMQELPEIVKLIDAYEEKGEEDLLVLAISLDSQPNSLEGVRALVEKTLDERKFELQRESISKVGLDPKGALSQAFQIRGIPTVVLLDREGVVRLVHVGFDPKIDLVEFFAEQIDPLLAPPEND